MRSVSGALAAALSARAIQARDFVWMTARNRTTDAVEEAGFWTDYGAVSIVFPDGETRVFSGAGALLEISPITLSADMSVREVSVALSSLDDVSENYIRGYDPRGGNVIIYRGLFALGTNTLLETPTIRFRGFVDHVVINTPKEGESGSIEMSCVSHTRELTRANSDSRSDASQKIRSSGDTFYRYTSTAAEWTIWWGAQKRKVKRDD